MNLPITPRAMRRLCAFALTTALAAGTALPASAVEPDRRGSGLVSALRAELDQYLAARGTAEHISADSLTVTFPGGRPGIDLAAGTTTYGGHTAVSADAPWQIGSNTKAFTSVILLQLEAEGRLSIDDPLSEYLPQYPQWGTITIRRLLNMTSGIPDYVSQPAFLPALLTNLNTTFTTDQLASYAYGLPLGPDAYAYTNTDYILAQMVIEKVTHDSYADQLTRRLLIPFGLHATCLGPDTCPTAAATSMATAYLNTGAGSPPFAIAVPALNLTYAQGAGGIIATLPDLAAWDRALYRGRLLPPRQQRELESLISTTTSQPIRTTTLDDPSGYGLGVIQVTTQLTGTVWFYEGETFGNRVLHVYDPATGVLVVIAANSYSTSDDLGDLAGSVIQTLRTGHATTSIPMATPGIPSGT